MFAAIPSSESGDADRHRTFWNERYQNERLLFGQQPNAFIRSEAVRIAPEREVVGLGAGEGRNLLYLAERYGHRVTAVDFAGAGLQSAQALAERRGLILETIQADVRSWQPSRDWDAVLVTFLQLLSPERVKLYRLVRQILRPGGWLLAEWFRPEHLNPAYASIGPGVEDRMVTIEELREHFPAPGIVRCAGKEVHLDDGPVLQGPAAVVQFVYREPRDE